MGFDIAAASLFDALATGAGTIGAGAAADVGAGAVAADLGATAIGADVAGTAAAGGAAAADAAAFAAPYVGPIIDIPASVASGVGAAGGAADIAGAAGVGAGGLAAADLALGTGSTAVDASGIGTATALGATTAPTPAAGAGAATPTTTPAASPTSAGAGQPSSGGVASPTEALSGSTGPLSALSGQNPTTFDQLWADRAAGPVNDAGGLGALTSGENFQAGAQSYAASTEPGAASLPSAITNPGAGTGSSVPLSSAATNAVTGGNNAIDNATLALDQPPPTNIAPTGAGAATTNAAGAPAPSTGLAALLSSSGLKTAATLAPLGLLGYEVAKGQPSLPQAEKNALSNIGGAENLASTDLTNAANNTITPAQAQQIATYEQNATNQLYQFYASQGRDPNQDTDFLQGVAQINANAIAMQQQFIDSMVTQGLSAEGAVNSTLQSAAQLQVQNDQEFQGSISAALQSFGLVAAISASGGNNKSQQQSA
jgi:hypothetical protein